MQNNKILNATRKYISDYCKKNKISAIALENKAGVSRDAIYAFLVGKVADLKLSTATKIADALSISLDELVDRQDALNKFSPKVDKGLQYKPELLIEILSYVNEFTANNIDGEYNFREVIYVISEIYEYSIHNKLNHIDRNFTEWFCKNQMHK